MTAYQSFGPEFELWLESVARKDRFSGAVLISKEDQILFEKAYGMASFRYGVENRVETRFNLGSMNKMFTGTAVIQQVQAGNLKLDTRVGEVLPEIENQDLKEKVTIQQLLNHTGGLGSYFNMKFMNGNRELYREVSDFLPLFINEKLSFEPGDHWEYSNSGFMLLGYILEKVSGLNYFDLIRRDIYQPAGMKDTDCYDMDLDVPDIATAYTLQDASGTYRKNSTFMHVIRGGPAGGGISTVRDLNRFAAALRNHVLLDEQHTKMLLENSVETGESDRRYACGFERVSFHDEIICGHGGGFPGINGKLEMYLNSGWTVIALANYDPPAADQVTSHLRFWIDGKEFPKGEKISRDKMQALCGVYDLQKPEFPEPFQIRIVLEDDVLVCNFGPVVQYTMLPLSETKFTDGETLTAEITVHYAESGIGETLVFKRKGFMGEFLRKE